MVTGAARPRSATRLAQIGEFSFILENVGREAGLTPFDRGANGSQTFIAAAVLLIALTPALKAIGDRFTSPTSTSDVPSP
jgi:CPA2 family monovalent cation:H+ antiporter-2